MRISVFEKEAIIDSLCEISSSKIDIYLFGSRTDDTKRGGDIDLLIIASGEGELNEFIKKRVDFLVSVKMKLGEQKIDLAIFDKSDLKNNNFYQSIKGSLILLK